MSPAIETVAIGARVVMENIPLVITCIVGGAGAGFSANQLDKESAKATYQARCDHLDTKVENLTINRKNFELQFEARENKHRSILAKENIEHKLQLNRDSQKEKYERDMILKGIWMNGRYKLVEKRIHRQDPI